jgi:hypothetical protein
MKNEYEWSDSGKKLLKTIINEIKEMGGMKPAYHIILTENSPIYKHKETANKFFYSRHYKANKDKAIKEKKFLVRHAFTDYELSVINNNLDMPATELTRLLPGRTYDSVKATRNFMKNKLRLIRMLV